MPHDVSFYGSIRLKNTVKDKLVSMFMLASVTGFVIGTYVMLLRLQDRLTELEFKCKELESWIRVRDDG